MIQEYDYSDDGYNLIGVFESRELLEGYILTNYPLFNKDEWGDYYLKIPDNKFSNNIYLNIYVEELHNARTMQKEREVIGE